MQNFSIKILQSAQFDLDEIWAAIAQSDIFNADRFVAKLEAKISSLSQFPEKGVARPDLFPDTRMLVEGQYLIFYQFEHETVIVMRVVHGARDLNELNLI